MPAETNQRLRKDALRTDRVYFSPNGPIPITRKRAQHWVNQFKRMSAAGLTVPVPFEHQDSAVPGNNKFSRSKANFGTLTELSIDDDGQLCFSCAPRDGVIQERKGKLPKFVSPQIHDKWVDPNGKVWRDVLTHMALTDIPVNAGQSDKWQIVKDGNGQKVNRMSLAGRWRMANEEDEEDSDEPAELESAADDAGDSMPDNPVETETPGAVQEELLQGVNADDQGDKIFKTVLAGLANTCQLVLPEDTTKENFWDRAATALIAMQGVADAQPDQPADEYEEESNYMGTGVAAMSQQKPQPQAAVPKRMSVTEIALNKMHHKQLVSRLSALVTSGRATPEEVEKKTQQVRTVRLSLAANGDLEPSTIETWIESREALPEGAACPQIDRFSLEPLGNPFDEDREEQRTRATTIATAPINY